MRALLAPSARTSGMLGVYRQRAVTMLCFVYASVRKPDSYLWLAQRDDFGALPPSLAQLLGELRFVLEVQLDEQRRLPHEDATVVREHLRTQGWHLQAPPPETLAAANHLAYQQATPDDRER